MENPGEDKNNLLGEETKVDTELVVESDSQASNEAETLLSELKITVAYWENKTENMSNKLQESSADFVVQSTQKSTDSAEETEVNSLCRKFSEFELLRNYLIVTYPAVVIPPLPEKQVNFLWAKIASIDTTNTESLESRRAGLELFLNRLSEHPKLSNDKFVKDFLFKQENFRSAIVATGFKARQDSWLKMMNASLRVKNPDIRLEQLKAHADHLQMGTSSLLKARAKVAERVFGIYKIHGNYSRIFKEWSLIEDPAFREALEKASTEVEKWTNSIDGLVNEENAIAERIKEYFHFAGSLKIICKRHEGMQYDTEWYENQIMLSMAEKERLQSGNLQSFSFSNVKSRLFGADTPERTKQKIVALDKKIMDLQEKFEQHRSAASEFLEEALQEVEIFNKRKVIDLKDVFMKYAVLQMKLHQEGAEVWSQFKSIFDNLSQQELK